MEVEEEEDGGGGAEEQLRRLKKGQPAGVLGAPGRGFERRSGLLADEAIRLLQAFYTAGNPNAPKPHRMLKTLLEPDFDGGGDGGGCGGGGNSSRADAATPSPPQE